MVHRFKTAPLVVILVAALLPLRGFAQRGRGGQAAPSAARAAAQIDLTGYWVSIVTEDWRWRMVTPAKGDYTSVPLSPEGRRVADTWDLARDKANGEECRAFGAAGLLRLPLRLHITWQDDNTLKLETDSGQQTRLFRFGAVQAPSGTRQWQGHSVAAWSKQPQSDPFGLRGNKTDPKGGNLKVVTTYMRPGYLRKNGVPYSEETVLTEYFNRHSESDGSDWFTVT